MTNTTRTVDPMVGNEMHGDQIHTWLRMLVTSVALATLAASGAAADPCGDQSPSYFPMHEGDQWVYTLTEGWPPNLPPRPPEAVQITFSYVHEGHRIFALENYGFRVEPGDYWFYQDRSGNTVELRADMSGIWYPWRERGTVAIPDIVTDCIHGHRGAFDADESTVEVPGTFPNVVTIRYHHQPCTDSGMISETFAPGIGLIERRVLGCFGELTWSLQCAVIDGTTYGGPDAVRLGAVASSPSHAAPVQSSTWGEIKAVFQP